MSQKKILFRVFNQDWPSNSIFFLNFELTFFNSYYLIIIQSSLKYYLILPSESHRESWDNIILLLLTKILKLEPIKVNKFNFFFNILKLNFSFFFQVQIIFVYFISLFL